MHTKVVMWRSLKTRVTLLTLAMFVVGLWSLAFYSSRRLRDDLRHLLGDQQFSAVTFVAGELNHDVVEMFGALGKVAGRVTPALLGDAAALQTFLEARLILQDPFNGGVVAYRRDGTAIAHVPRSAAPVSVNSADSDAVRAALTTGESTVGRPVPDSTGNAAVFAMAVPIRDARGAVIGALAGRTNTSRPSFLGSISSSHYGRTGAYSVVAAKYRLIFASGREDHRMVTLPESGAALLYDRIFAGYEGSFLYVTPAGEQRLASVKGVPAAGWVVTTSLAADEVFAPVRVLQQRVLLAAILLTLLAGGLAWWALWRAFRPLEEAERMLVLASGLNLPLTPLPVTRRDEVGRLIGSFNRLLARLNERDAALQRSHEDLRIAQRIAHVGSWYLDLATNQAQWSEELFLMLGLDPAGEAPDHADAARLFTAESWGRLSHAIAVAQQTGGPCELELEMLRADGVHGWMLARGEAARDGHDAVVGVRGVAIDITVRKRTEALQSAGARLAGMSDASTLDEVLQFALDECESMTGSRIGFAHFLDADETTLQLQMWSTRTLDGMCTAEGKGSHYPVLQAGVWADCVAARAPLVHNDYANLPHRKGLPPGHAPVVRELVVPLLRDGVVVMIMGVGNKATDYHAWDVAAVSRVLELVWDVVQLKRTAAAQRQSEETLHRIFATMSEAVALNEVVYDAHGEMVDYRIVLVNEAFHSVADYGDEQIIGNVATRLYGMSPEAITAFWQSHRDREDVQHTELLSPYKGRWYHVSTSPIVDHRFVTSFFDITERKTVDAALNASLREKEALLKEVHHRVKNNLQVITSLLRLEAGRSSQPDTKSVLADMQGRIQSMALLHEALYRSGSFATVDLGAYLRKISTQEARVLASRAGHVALRLDVRSVFVDMDQAIPCGLLVNELVSNCFKHGFPGGRSGEVLIELHELADGTQLRLRVSDTGVGLPSDFDARRSTSLGLQLAGDLAVQLGGHLDIGPGPAAVFSVTFVVDTPAPAATLVGAAVSTGAAL